MLTFLKAIADHVPVPLFFIIAAIGHGYMLMVAVNVLYAHNLPHKILGVVRRMIFSLVLLGPVIFAVMLDIFDTGQLTWTRDSWRFYFAPYAVVCFLVGAVLLPIFQLMYLLRPAAKQITSRKSVVADVALELGHKPLGRGKHWKFGLLPGNQIFKVEFVTLEIRLPQIPDVWDGLSILHLTDLHLHGTPDRRFHQWVIDRCMQDGVPDLVCITGDIVDSRWHHRWIMPVLGRLRWNIAGVAILGNHDTLFDTKIIRRRLGRVGLINLGNGWQQIDVRGEPMILIGNETPWIGPAADLAECPEGPFRLCLSHSPDTISWARKQRTDLMLAGHVHGGQIRFPIAGSIFVPSRYSRHFDCGTFYLAPTVMHVGRGLSGQHPLRFNCLPEVTRIILRKG